MLNKVQLIGNVGKEPEIRAVGDSRKVVNFSLATSESWKDQQGNKIEHTTWHNIEIWGNSVGVIEKYVHKGSKLYLEGKIKTEEYEKDGVKKYITKINCNNMVMLDSKPQTQQAPANTNVPDDAFDPPATVEGEDDLPF